MKILLLIYDHVNNPWIGGGGAVRSKEINCRLAKKGHEITVVTGLYSGAENYLEDGVNYIFLGDSSSYVKSVFSYAKQARLFLKENYKKFDIIIEEFAPWNTVDGWKYQKEKTVILQQHHVDGKNILKRYNVLGLPFYFIEKTYHKRYKYITSCSAETLEKMNRMDGFPLSSGVDNRVFNMDIKDDEYLLYVGRIDYYNKGLDLIVRSDITMPVVIAGKGKDFELMLEDIEGKSNFKYVGFVSDDEKFELMSKCRALLMPSRFEGQGIVALEAAALGKPVIVSDIPELDFTVKNGFGIPFESGNQDSFNSAVKLLCSNADFLRNSTVNGRKFAEPFTWDNIADQYEEYIMKVFNG